MWNTANTVVRGKCMAFNLYIRKEECSKSVTEISISQNQENQSTLRQKEGDKEEQKSLNQKTKTQIINKYQ